MPQKKQKILVGLSGGVDSAVSLYLLKKEGYDVEAAFMKNFSDKVNIKGECPWKEDKLEAYRVAAFLKVPIRTFDFEKEYKDTVVKYLFDTYRKGQTPNPDILCNNEIKFKLFLQKAISLGFDKIAMGHYAQVKHDKFGYHLLRGKDKDKDQSYFLAGLTQEQLSKTLFPVGNLTKAEVRKIAKDIKLPNAERKDSQGICFIGKIKLKDFLAQKIKAKPGKIIDTQGNVLGKHQGIHSYTIGQRKGIDIGRGGPWYVVKKDIKKNILVVGHKEEAELYTKEIRINNWHWLGKEYKFPLSANAQIRYRQTPQKVTIRHSGAQPTGQAIESQGSATYTATFTKPQTGVASGQILAVYRGKELIGSGVIE